MANGNGKLYNPYAPITIVPLFPEGGGTSVGQSVRLQLEAGDSLECGVVKGNYELIANDELADAQTEIAQLLAPKGGYTESKLYFDGKHFARTLRFPASTRNIVGKAVAFGTVAWNSYDGTRAAGIETFAEILACSNGMTSMKYFTRHIFRHVNTDGWKIAINKAFTELQERSRGDYDLFCERLDRSMTEKVTYETLASFREKGKLILPAATSWVGLFDQFFSAPEQTSYELVNAATSVLWHAESFSSLAVNSRVVDLILSLNFN